MPLITGLSYRIRWYSSNFPHSLLFWDLPDLKCLSSIFIFSIDMNLSSLTWTRRLRQLKKFHRAFIFHQMWFQVPPSRTHPTDRRWGSSSASIAHWVVVRGTTGNTHGGFVCSSQLSHSRETSPAKGRVFLTLFKTFLRTHILDPLLDLVFSDCHLLWWNFITISLTYVLHIFWIQGN